MKMRRSREKKTEWYLFVQLNILIILFSFFLNEIDFAFVVSAS